MTNDPTSAAYAALKQSILKNGKISKSSVTYSQKIYSNNTAGPVETRSQSVVEIGLDDLMELATKALAEAETRGRIDFAKSVRDAVKLEFEGGGRYPGHLIDPWRDVARPMIYLQANADGANGRDGEEK